MAWFLVAVAVLAVGGILALATGRRAALASVLGAGSVVIGSGAIAVQAIAVLARGEVWTFRSPWHVPMGSFSLAMDPLSAVFVAAIALITAMAAIYGCGYLRDHAQHRSLGPAWFFFNLLTASMFVVVTARNGVLFLVAWELMSLSSFFLVMFEAERESVRRAGWTYLVAMHLGTAFLVAMFLSLGRGAATLDFEHFAAAPGMAGILFVLAVIGFGTKAGFLPMHVWLPEAHPAAPSHVSAVMSGVMIKTGIYGLLRTLTWLGPPPAWWGWALVLVGGASGILGVLWALAQHDLKRLLAYHSVENVGIIALGIGVGMLGVSYANPTMTALGFAGALLHVVNHAVFKSLLFFGAGAVAHATGTREIDHLGGLLKRMPTTGATFLVGAAAICGLPPLNGFVSEFLIYLGAASGLSGRVPGPVGTALASVLAMGALVLIGGLAAACFTKAFGVVFLGEPRSAEAQDSHEVGAAMRWPMVLLAGVCLLIGLAAPFCPRVLAPAVAVAAPWSPDLAAAADGASAPLRGVTFGTCGLLAGVVLLAAIRRRLLARRSVEQGGTWDCGYVAPSPRMQYTASSFAQPVVHFFHLLLRPHSATTEPRGLFPSRARLHTHTPDLLRQWVYQPLFLVVAWVASKFRWMQQGRIQMYVLYIALTILLLMLWKLG